MRKGQFAPIQGLLLAAIALGFSTEALAERRLVFGRPIGSSGSVVSRGIGGSSFIRLDQLKEVNGTFSKLRTFNNNLVEFSSDAFGNPRVSQLFIDGAGRLVGATTQDTVKQVKEFYLANFDQFRGNASNLVQRFLIANGGANTIRGFTVDLGSSIIPQVDAVDEATGKKVLRTVKYAQGKEEQVKLAALNFLINTISQSKDLFTVNPSFIRGGQVGVNLLRFMRPEAIALLTSNNPYACGNPTAPVRLDFMVARAMDPDVYYQLTGSPKKFADLAKQFGISEQRRDYPGTHIVVAGPPGQDESLVGRHPQRIVGFRNELNVPGGDAFLSYDNRYNLPPGQQESADAFRNGIDTSFEAGESIYTKPNGFMSFYLNNNPAGDRQRSAPVEFAQSSIHAGLVRRESNASDVSAPINCLVCHANGILGGGISPRTEKQYTDNLNNVPVNQRQFFTSNAVYRARGNRFNQIWRNALVASGSFVEDPESQVKASFPGQKIPAPLLPDFLGEYGALLTIDRAAKELGAPVAQVASLLKTNSEGKVSRKQFEAQFCNLKAALGGGSSVASGSFQTPIQQGFGGGNFGLRSPSNQSHL